jgi:hypothetical protein
MGTTYIQLELPRDLYDRLESMAETRQIDPVTLIQYWLEAMEQSGKTSQASESPSAPIYPS